MKKLNTFCQGSYTIETLLDLLEIDIDLFKNKKKELKEEILKYKNYDQENDFYGLYGPVENILNKAFPENEYAGYVYELTKEGINYGDDYLLVLSIYKFTS